MSFEKSDLEVEEGTVVFRSGANHERLKCTGMGRTYYEIHEMFTHEAP